ncbi:MAG: LD-carboxypeptidase [Dolichospermum sp.]
MRRLVARHGRHRPGTEEVLPFAQRRISRLGVHATSTTEPACGCRGYPKSSQALSAFLTDPEVAAIFPPWGGELATEVLEHLDFGGLRHLRPKWFMG